MDTALTTRDYDATLPNVVALYSPVMGSGKTTIAEFLVAVRGYTLVKFASPIKAMARGLFEGMGFDPETVERMIEGDLKETVVPGLTTATPRHIMQTIGTEWGREAIQNDLWIKTAMAKVDVIVSEGGKAVIDDMRFPNEHAAVLRRNDAALIRVIRPNAAAYAAHPSEGLLDDQFFDMTIQNRGTIQALIMSFDYGLSRFATTR